MAGIQQDNNLHHLYQNHQNQLAAGTADFMNYLRSISHQIADYQQM
jgi:hypothetical protein